MQISSMTGFARQSGSMERDGFSLSWVWEIKSVNGKNLDLKVRLPGRLHGQSNHWIFLLMIPADFLAAGNPQILENIAVICLYPFFITLQLKKTPGSGKKIYLSSSFCYEVTFVKR